MSFWSAPRGAGLGNVWLTPEHERRSWVVSSGLLRRHFPKVELVTDVNGWAWLRRYDLPFTSVRLDLEDLNPAWTRLWSLGKMRAYGLQDEPFVHLDNDAFLLKPLPARLDQAPVLAQMPEKFLKHGSTRNYKIEALAGLRPLPELVSRAMRQPIQYAFNLGIFGGNDLETIHEHSRLCFDMLNAEGWEKIDGFDGLILLEQWLIGAVLRERRQFIEYLYPCLKGPQGYYARQEEVGFVHLWNGDKRNPAQLARLDAWYDGLVMQEAARG